mmetsp:Transcript_38226/g.121722  ORF Transcript_38226/g.121722 Transcript_38226/m.121722 type:complete len:247 (-) Transcript_38226:1194-1934(-)
MGHTVLDLCERLLCVLDPNPPDTFFLLIALLRGRKCSKPSFKFGTPAQCRVPCTAQRRVSRHIEVVEVERQLEDALRCALNKCSWLHASTSLELHHSCLGLCERLLCVIDHNPPGTFFLLNALLRGRKCSKPSFKFGTPAQCRVPCTAQRRVSRHIEVVEAERQLDDALRCVLKRCSWLHASTSLELHHSNLGLCERLLCVIDHNPPNAFVLLRAGCRNQEGNNPSFKFFAPAATCVASASQSNVK